MAKKNEVVQQIVPTITVGHTPIEIALGIDEQDVNANLNCL